MHHNWEGLSTGGATSIMTTNSAWFNQHQSVQVKTEPTDYSNFLQQSDQQSPQQQPPQLSPILTQNTLDLLEQLPTFRQLGFNPLTPPGCSPTSLIYPQFLSKAQKGAKTPSKKHHQHDSAKNDLTSDSITPPPPSIDVTPPKSPSLADQTPEKDEGVSNSLEMRSDSNDSFDDDSCDEEDDELAGMLPDKAKKRRTNSNKPRQYKCKQCKQIFTSKSLFWDHTKSHIKPEKMLRCPECAFVTEYKHHLEYHLRNHQRSKPFQCPHCNYSCVNKSMLNSHLKSHSTILQYRCLDCNYATKYCHSLKLHLRKYAHKPDIVLNLDGTPNPLPIIDVYGTRRGPKSKATTERLLAEIEKNQAAQRSVQKSQLSPPLTPSTLSQTTSTNNSITSTPPSSMLPSNAAMMVNLLQNKMPLFPYFNLNFQMFAAQQQKFNEENNIHQHHQHEEADTNFVENSSPIVKPVVVKSRTKRKGKAFKFEEKINETMCDSDDNMEQLKQADTITTLSNENSNPKVTSSMSIVKETTAAAAKEIDYECKFCGIVFKDNVLFSLHIGYHSLGEDPFRCNMCGTKTEDKVQFFLHIAKYPHS